MTSLLHQKWKDLYDIGIVLQYSYGSSNSWYTVNHEQTTECLSFNSVNYKYRINPNNVATKKMYITKDNITFDEVLGFNNNGWYVIAGDRGKRHCNPIYYTLSIPSEIKDTTMYEYLPIGQVKVGSVVQLINNEYYRNIPTDSLHIVDSLTSFNSIKCNTISGTALQSDRFKLIKTKPGSEAKTGDVVIRFKDGTSTMPTGGIFKAKTIAPDWIYYDKTLSANKSECLVLCTIPERKFKPGDIVHCLLQNNNRYYTIDSVLDRSYGLSPYGFLDFADEELWGVVTLLTDKVSLNLAKSTNGGWYIATTEPYSNGNRWYLRKDLKLSETIYTKNPKEPLSGYWETEIEANEARDTYIGDYNKTKQRFKHGDLVEFIDPADGTKFPYPEYLGRRELIKLVESDTIVELEKKPWEHAQGNRIHTSYLKVIDVDSVEIKKGSHWERIVPTVLLATGTKTSNHEIVQVEHVFYTSYIEVKFNNNRSLPKKEFLKTFKEKPDLGHKTFSIGEWVIPNFGTKAYEIKDIQNNCYNSFTSETYDSSSNKMFSFFESELRYATTDEIWKAMYVAEDSCESTEVEFGINNNQTQKEDSMPKTILDLMFLSELLKMSTQEEQKDATNSNLVAIMIDKNSKYIGYFCANTDAEVKEIAARPENEGNKICVFEYKTTYSQKPRRVIEVGRD